MSHTRSGLSDSIKSFAYNRSTQVVDATLLPIQPIVSQSRARGLYARCFDRRPGLCHMIPYRPPILLIGLRDAFVDGEVAFDFRQVERKLLPCDGDFPPRDVNGDFCIILSGIVELLILNGESEEPEAGLVALIDERERFGYDSFHASTFEC